MVNGIKISKKKQIKLLPRNRKALDSSPDVLYNRVAMAPVAQNISAGQHAVDPSGLRSASASTQSMEASRSPSMDLSRAIQDWQLAFPGCPDTPTFSNGTVSTSLFTDTRISKELPAMAIS